MSAEPNKAGRPSKYTPILAKRICEFISQGKSKRAIAELEGMPHRETIDNWLLKHEGFSSQYARACERRAELYAEEIVDIADRGDIGADHKRVMVDARKWVVSKLLPRQYGESMTLKGDKNNPLQVVKAVDLPESALLAIAAGEKSLDG